MAVKTAGAAAGRRRLRSVLWWSAGSALLLYVFTLVTVIIYRHPRRFDFTEEEANSLSAETLNRLQLLNEDVRVIYPYFFQLDNPLHRIQARILLRARGLLSEYVARQPHLQIGAELNLSRFADSETWKRICEENDLTPTQYNRFIFLPAKGDLRQAVTPDDLAIYDRPAGRSDRAPPQVRKFRAQEALTAALTRIVEREKKRVYAVEDHREAGIRDDGRDGLSLLRRELETSGFEVLPLKLRTEPRVPGNCDLLLIVAPAAPFEIEDRQKVNDYLLGGGRLLVTLGQDETGLESLLDSWGIRVQTGRVYQRAIRGPRAVWDPLFQVGEFNSGHRITEQFRRGSFAMQFADTRPLDPRGGEGLTGEYLLRTSEHPPSFVDRNRNGRRDELEDEGRVIVAGAVWRKPPARPPPGYRHVDVRLVALGDSTAIRNQFFEQLSHRDFLLNSVNWLVGREEQVVEGGSAWTERRLKWDPGIERFMFWVPIFLFPAIVVSFGGFVYFLRRS